jgi:hypothetical protein
MVAGHVQDGQLIDVGSVAVERLDLGKLWGIRRTVIHGSEDSDLRANAFSHIQPVGSRGSNEALLRRVPGEFEDVCRGRRVDLEAAASQAVPKLDLATVLLVVRNDGLVLVERPWRVSDKEEMADLLHLAPLNGRRVQGPAS